MLGFPPPPLLLPFPAPPRGSRAPLRALSAAPPSATRLRAEWRPFRCAQRRRCSETRAVSMAERSVQRRDVGGVLLSFVLFSRRLCLFRRFSLVSRLPRPSRCALAPRTHRLPLGALARRVPPLFAPFSARVASVSDAVARISLTAPPAPPARARHACQRDQPAIARRPLSLSLRFGLFLRRFKHDKSSSSALPAFPLRPSLSLSLSPSGVPSPTADWGRLFLLY